MRRSLAIGLILCLAIGPAGAQEGNTGPRCNVLGQITLATWLEVMAALNDPDRDAVNVPLQRLSNLTGTYSSIGCDTSRLGAAMDCLLDRSGSAGSREVARRCLQENGLVEAQ